MGWAARSRQRLGAQASGRDSGTETQRALVPAFRGPGGLRRHYIVRPKFADGDLRNEIPVIGARGSYEVVVTFARPGHDPLPERQVSLTKELDGDSHLAMSPPAVARGVSGLRVETWLGANDQQNIVFDLKPNKQGFLATAETKLEADTFDDAERRAMMALTPTLSAWSSQLDVPLRVFRIQVTELASLAVYVSVPDPFDNVGLVASARGQLSEDFRAFASLYREGIETNSPPYAFLCFYKIAEGIRERRTRLTREIAQHGGSPPRRRPERLPTTAEECRAWLAPLFVRLYEWDDAALQTMFPLDVRGRKVGDVVGGDLRLLRNDIGHAFSEESGEPSMVADDALHTRRVVDRLPLMKVIARRMMKNEFSTEFLAQNEEPWEGRSRRDDEPSTEE